MRSPPRWRDAGAETVLVSGPVELAAPARRQAACGSRPRARCWRPAKPQLPADIAVCAAAVADWRPEIAANSQDQESDDRAVPLIKLVENPDILAGARASRARGRAS